jgi:hypothetical protein
MPSSDAGAKDRWRELAERAMQEHDPDKLNKIINDLCAELEEKQKQRENRKQPRNGGPAQSCSPDELA